MTVIQALAALVEFPGTIPRDPTERLKFVQEMLTEANDEWHLKQEVDDAIALPPGLEEVSDLALNMAYDRYLPMLLSSFLGKLIGA